MFAAANTIDIEVSINGKDEIGVQFLGKDHECRVCSVPDKWLSSASRVRFGAFILLVARLVLLRFGRIFPEPGKDILP